MDQKRTTRVTDAWIADQMTGPPTTPLGEATTAAGLGPADVDLTSNIYLWGPTGSGTTVLTDLVIAAARLRPNTLVWLIDPDGLFTARDWIRPLLAGDTKLPAVDWVATNTHQAMHMMATAARLATLRAEDRNLPATQITIVFASGRGLFGFNGLAPVDQHAADTLRSLAEIASLDDTGINFVIAAHRYLPGKLPAAVTNAIRTFIALGRANPDEIGYAFGAKAAADTEYPYAPGAGRIGDRNEYRDFQAYFVGSEQVHDIALRANPARLDDTTAEKLTSTYTYRWAGVLHTLADGAPVPADLATLGQPVVPDTLAAASRREMAHGIRQAVDDGSPQLVAAAEILINGCGGRLLTSPVLRDAGVFFAEGGQLYVRWSLLTESSGLADKVGVRGEHPDAPVLLRIIGHLATGGFTDDTLDTLIDALMIAGGDNES